MNHIEYDEFGVAVVTMIADNVVLIVEQMDNPVLGTRVGDLSPVFGHIEGEETVVDTCCREYPEENGGRIYNVIPFGFFPIPKKGQSTSALAIACFADLLEPPENSRIVRMSPTEFLSLHESKVRVGAQTCVSLFLDWQRQGRPHAHKHVADYRIPDIIQHAAHIAASFQPARIV